ncbi:MAG: MFS transporter, partial [Alphaproteobacteria bacterium]
AMPMAVFTMGNLTGVGVAMILGGPIALYVAQFDAITLPLFGDIFPWQLTFFFVGLPGIGLALLVLSLREPARRGLLNLEAQSEPALQSLIRFAQFYRQHWKAFSTLIGSFTLLVLMAYANFAWMPTFFRRTFGWDIAEAGVNYGMIVLFAGTSGAFFGGWFSNFLARRGYRDAPFRATMLCTLPLAPAAFGTFILADTGMEAVLWFIPWQFFGSVPAGLAGTAMMTITPNEMRAKISSFYLFFSNLIGVTIGAALVAWLTQEVFADEMRIGESLAIVNCLVAPVAVLIIWRGMRYFRNSRDQVEALTAQTFSSS